MRFASIVFVMLGILALCTAALAQPGPGMGFGMFGGPPTSVSMTYGLLLNIPTVQKELDLTTDQKTKITAANEKLMSSMRDLFSGMQPPSPDMTPEERQKMREEMTKKMQPLQEELKKSTESILIPNQTKRLKEIALQIVGTQALSDKQIQEELKLSTEQVAKIKKINEDMDKKRREMFAEAAGDFQSLGPKMQELRQDTDKQLVGVLTDAQKAALEKMKGEKLEIPADELGGPGGFRGRGGRGGPGRGN
jgi:Spy/CpxP family protein refolding chaperone